MLYGIVILDFSIIKSIVLISEVYLNVDLTIKSEAKIQFFPK